MKMNEYFLETMVHFLHPTRRDDIMDRYYAVLAGLWGQVVLSAPVVKRRSPRRSQTTG